MNEVLPQPVRIFYTNWKGETAWRNIVPKELWFGATQYHLEPQWLLKAIDLDKNAERDFAMQDILTWTSVEV